MKYERGRFRAEQIRVRQLDKCTIVFWDARTIYVCVENGISVAFHRWWAPRGSFAAWHNFYMRMLKNKNLTLTKCYGLAIKHDVVGQVIKGEIDLDGKEVKYIK